MKHPPQGWDSELTGEGVVAAHTIAEMFAALPRLELVFIFQASRKLPSGRYADAGWLAGRLAEEAGVLGSCSLSGQCAAWGVQCACLEGLGQQLRECQQAEADGRHTERAGASEACLRAECHKAWEAQYPCWEGHVK